MHITQGITFSYEKILVMTRRCVAPFDRDGVQERGIKVQATSRTMWEVWRGSGKSQHTGWMLFHREVMKFEGETQPVNSEGQKQ